MTFDNAYVTAVPVLDPEIVCLKPDAMYDSDQLKRLVECTDVEGIRIGSQTKQAMGKTMCSYFEGSAGDERFALYDIANTISCYYRMQELEGGANDYSSVVGSCGYHSCFGDEGNEALLEADLSSIAYGQIVIVSDACCWNTADARDGCLLSENVWLAGYTESCSVVSIVNRCKRNQCRGFIQDHPEDKTVLSQFARHAFPELVFSDSLFQSVDKLKRDYRDNLGIIVRHFSVLNDDAVGIWTEYTDSRERAKRMAALGVDCSGERGSTKMDAEAVRERTAMFNGQQKVCLWHTKLHGNTDRIHFCVEEGVVYVGLFAAHCK